MSMWADIWVEDMPPLPVPGITPRSQWPAMINAYVAALDARLDALEE